MQKSNQRFSIIVFLLIAALFSLVLKNNWSKLFPQKTESLFSKIKKNKIIQISLSQNSKKTNLYLKNNHWYLKKNNIEYKADEKRIRDIIDSFISLKKEEVVSKNKNKHSQFGIGKDKISFKTNKKTYTLYIGKPQGLDKNYLRINNSAEVFIAQGFNNVFYPEDFRDLRVKFINQENNITQVIISFNGSQIVLKKKKKDWFINKDKVKKESIDFFLNDLKTLKAEDIVSDNVIVKQPLLTIKVKENNTEKIAEFFAKNKTDDNNNYYLKTSNSSLFFEVSSNSVDNLKKERQYFLEK